MTLEGVIALVSRGDGTWTVTYRDYAWTVDEDAGSVRPIGDPLPCPRR